MAATIFDPAIFDPVIFDTGASSGGGSGQRAKTMAAFNLPFTHASFTAPSSVTTLTAILSANSVTLPADTMALFMQATGAGVNLEFDGTNATTASYLLQTNYDVVFEKKNLHSDWFDNITLIRNAANATLYLSASK